MSEGGPGAKAMDTHVAQVSRDLLQRYPGLGATSLPWGNGRAELEPQGPRGVAPLITRDESESNWHNPVGVDGVCCRITQGSSLLATLIDGPKLFTGATLRSRL